MKSLVIAIPRGGQGKKVSRPADYAAEKMETA